MRKGIKPRCRGIKQRVLTDINIEQTTIPFAALMRQGEQASASQIENIKKINAHPFHRKLMGWAKKFALNRQKTVSYSSV